MSDWYENFIKTLQLNGKEKHSQEAYTRAMRMLFDWIETRIGVKNSRISQLTGDNH